MKNKNAAFIAAISAMLLFGPIGIVRKLVLFIPSGLFASLRGIIGSAFIFAFILIFKRKFAFVEIKRGLLLMALSGAMIGFNWILLFEAYNYTSVAVATLCYYTAPVIVILTSPLLFGEKLTAKKLLCSGVAFFGTVMISGIFGGEISGLTGIIMGLGAAVLYAGVIITNKFLKDYPVYEKTAIQLLFAGVTVLPYSLIAEDISFAEAAGSQSVLIFGCVAVVAAGLLFTGLPYTLYFGSMSVLSAQSVALISYIDPITAVVLSAVVLKEGFSLWEVLGAVLILGSTAVCELPGKKKGNVK